jgi:hypothetical protein
MDRSPGTKRQRVIFLQDDESKQQFLVDTSGAVSTLPHRSPLTPSGVCDSGADTKSIPCCGEIHCRLTCRLRTFFVTFLLAFVSRPILGLDFLSVHRLLVDPVGHQLLDSKSFKPFAKPAHRCWQAALKVRLRPLLHLTNDMDPSRSFPSHHWRPEGYTIKKHKICLTIQTTGRPVFTKACR